MRWIIILLCMRIFLTFTLSAHAFSLFNPVGYPWSFSGEINGIYGSQYDVFHRPKTDVYLEQGIDLFELKPGIRFNTFVAGKFANDTDSTRLGPWFGVQFRLLGVPAFLPGGAPGQINIGIRGEQDYYLYSSDSRQHEIRGVLFIRWSFDGDHRKR